MPAGKLDLHLLPRRKRVQASPTPGAWVVAGKITDFPVGVGPSDLLGSVLVPAPATAAAPTESVFAESRADADNGLCETSLAEFQR